MSDALPVSLNTAVAVAVAVTVICCKPLYLQSAKGCVHLLGEQADAYSCTQRLVVSVAAANSCHQAFHRATERNHYWRVSLLDVN